MSYSELLLQIPAAEGGSHVFGKGVYSVSDGKDILYQNIFSALFPAMKLGPAMGGISDR